MKHTRWIAMLLALVMVLGLMPGTVHATSSQKKAGGETEESWLIEGSHLSDTLLDPGDTVGEEVEPNDDPETANWIYHDLTVVGTLSGEDQDCYAFELGEASPVTITSACTTENLMYGLFDGQSGELIVECGYIGYDEESGMHADGLTCELPAGIYLLLFLEMNNDDAEYLFYLDAPGYGEEPHYHTYDEGVVTQEPTCVIDGIMTYTCIECGEVFTESIPAPGHDYVDGICCVCGEEKPEPVFQCGQNLTAKLDESTGTLTISGTGAMDGYQETGHWNQEYEVKHVVIEEGATSVGQKAFRYCQSLLSVQLPGTLKSIEPYAFENCSSLSGVILPEGLERLGEGCFMQCAAQKEFVVPDSVTMIADSAFWGCGAEKITIGTGIEELYITAFNYCSSLKEIHFTGDAPEFLGEDGFTRVTATVYYPQDNDTWTEELKQSYNGDLTWVAVPSHVHSYTSVVTAPTCTEKGYTTYTCSSCGNSYKDNYVDALSHSYGKPEFIGRDEGHSYTCTRCDAIKTESCIFDGGSVVKEASLDDFGTTKHTCTVCGGSYETEFAYRISGKGRCETAYAAADLLKETLDIEKFDAIIIASGENFADALSGSFLAARKNAPILLFMKGYEERNLAYITENLASGGTVYILGGTASVAQSMEDALEGYAVKRLSGKSRFDTNLAILEEAGVGNEDILVCTGWNFADCLSASATGLPILLVDSKAGKLTETQTEFLAEAMDNDFVIIGGTNTVSQEIEDALRNYGEVGRLNGKSRYETSVLVAEKFFTEAYAMADPDIALLTNGQNFPDGLCGGPLAYALKAPILLVNEKNEKAAAAYIAENGITRGAILGGSASVSDASGEIAFGLK